MLPVSAMDNLAKRSYLGALKFQAVLAVLIFGPALSVRYWQGWLFWAVFFACVLVTTSYFLKHDPGLVERRLRAGPMAEPQSSQKLIQTFASIFVIAVFVVSALDHLRGWSSISWPLVIIGNALVILGFVMMFFVFRENSFAAATVQVTPDQKIVSTGPYAIVRHPMYAGAMVMFIGVPIALGSWWGLVPVALLAVVLAWRLLDEEVFMLRSLPGYADYQRKVRSRLVPGVW